MRALDLPGQIAEALAAGIVTAAEADQLAVIDPASGAPLGVLTEPYLARRYAEKADAAVRSAFGV